jgi:hypothetical protein
MNLPQRLALLASVSVFVAAAPTSALAQDAAPAATAQPSIPGGSLTTAELEEMLGPIALYPDELLANVLAASVYPDEVAEAANFMKSPGAKDKIDSRDWEAPVKAIAKVPDVLKMMAEFPDWTTAIGQAYLTQAQDVMATIQTLRKKAKANGSLISNDQQTVVVQQDTVYIQAADPEIIYVPSYEPTVVYVDDPYDDAVAAGIIGFGMGVAVGAIWADLDCDWHHGCVGWGDVDVDIDRNFNGDINIGNDVNIGNGNRVGNQGGAWAPNRTKANAGTKPDARQNFKSGSPTAAAPRTSSAARAPSRPAASPSRAAATPRTQAPSSSRAAGAARTPTAPSSSRAQSAFSGGSDTRASSSRGTSSRQSASRSSSAGNRSAGGGRSSGGSRGGGSRGGGGRGGGRR